MSRNYAKKSTAPSKKREAELDVSESINNKKSKNNEYDLPDETLKLFVYSEDLKNESQSSNIHPEWPSIMPVCLLKLQPKNSQGYKIMNDYLRIMTNSSAVSLIFTSHQFKLKNVAIKSEDNDIIERTKTFSWSDYFGLWGDHYLSLNEEERNAIHKNARKLINDAIEITDKNLDENSTEFIQFCNGTQSIFLNINNNKELAKLAFSGTAGPRFPQSTLRSKRRKPIQDKSKLSSTISAKTLYDENCLLRYNNVDLCDCLDENCPGCVYKKCSKCNSNKCCYGCRKLRVYAPLYYCDEFANVVTKFPYKTPNPPE